MLIDFKYLWDHYKIKADGVLHLGANLAQEEIAYRDAGIKEVIWVEAIPEMAIKLCKALRSDSFFYQRVLQACLSDVDGKKVKFNIASNGGQSSSFLQFGTHAKEHPTVKYTNSIDLYTSRLDSLFAQRGISLEGKTWFLNVDLQGAELLALKGMGDLLWHCSYAYVEVNIRELYKGCPNIVEIDGYLAQYGFVGMETKMTGAGWGDKFYQRFAKK